MARLHYNVIPWGNKYDGPNYYKDGRRGALDDEYWDEDELVDYRRLAKNKEKKPRAGCPENNNGSHVWVWVPYVSSWSGMPWDGYEQKVCCGCLTHKRGRKSWRRNV